MSEAFAWLRELEPVVWRAPSAHNTQPWYLEYGAARAAVRWHPERELPIADPTARDLFLSLGAFVETCLIAAASTGRYLHFTPDVDEAAHRAGWLEQTTTPYATRFDRAAIEQRVSSRGAYEPGTIDDDLLAQLQQLAREHGGDMHHVGTRELVPLLLEADRYMFDSTPITFELRHWLRLSKRDKRYFQDGLTYEALVMTTVEAKALAVLLARAIYRPFKKLGLASALASASKSLLDYDGSALVLAGTAADTRERELEFGRLLMRLWLTINRAGRYTHPLSQIIDAPSTYAQLHSLLGAKEDERLLAIFRVGRSPKPTASSRLR